MDMLHGKIDGAVKENETRGNVYCATNFFHSVEFYLTQRDRVKEYGEKGFEVKVFSKEQMIKAGAQPFTDLPSCLQKVRMLLPAIFNQSIFIQPGGHECPVTNMTAVVYMDNNLDESSFPIQVHRIELMKRA